MGLYILKCQKGQEQLVVRACARNLSKEALNNAFVFTYERMKKYHGRWHIETKEMFPEYVFLDSNNEYLLKKELSLLNGIAVALESKYMLLSVHKYEEDYLTALCGPEHHMKMSYGSIKKGLARVTDGPLKGYERHIKRIDRHKRLAVVDALISERKVTITTGLEIVDKG